MIRRRIFIVLLFANIFNIATGQSFDPDNKSKGYLNTITTAVPFLLISPDSRSGAMGDIGAATSADASSQSHNPAKYVFNQNRFGVSFSYSPWLSGLVRDVNLLYLSGYYRITRMDAIGFSLRYFGLGEIDFRDEEGNMLVPQKPNEFAIDFTYSRKLIDKLSMAITPRFVYSDLTAGQNVGQMETSAGLAGAADISLFYEQNFDVKNLLGSTLRIGLNIQNLGNKIKYLNEHRRDFIPANLKLGIGYSMRIDEYNSLGFSVDVNKLLVPTPPIMGIDSATHERVVLYGYSSEDQYVAESIFKSFADAPGGFVEELRELTVGMGIEYSYRDLLFVRMGYFYENPYKGGRNFFTFGAGLKYNIIGLDMSYLWAVGSAHNPLENTLRFSLTFDLSSFDKNEIKKQGINEIKKQGSNNRY